jgi:hypothetical protein
MDRPAGAGFPTERPGGRSPVDGRMDNPAGCPRAHPQAVGCPQAPQGPTTGDGEVQAIPRPPLRHRRPANVRQGGRQPARPHSFLQSQPRNPAPKPRSVTFPKSPVTFAEMRTCVALTCRRRRASAPERHPQRSRPSAFAGLRRGHPLCQLRLRDIAASAAARCWEPRFVFNSPAALGSAACHHCRPGSWAARSAAPLRLSGLGALNTRDAA